MTLTALHPFSLTSIVPSFKSNAIRDHHRLGKFHQESTRLCPILMKLNQTPEVASLLFKSTEITLFHQIRPHSIPEAHGSSSTQATLVPHQYRFEWELHKNTRSIYICQRSAASQISRPNLSSPTHIPQHL